MFVKEELNPEKKQQNKVLRVFINTRNTFIAPKHYVFKHHTCKSESNKFLLTLFSIQLQSVDYLHT